ncbi:hypothetical protein COLO4_30450 [Corchorus olitorius]|uniref:S locus-related glycoprotein 1 binding pollen coat n=1 Tax=Corchorus olitorius TaxID=93759 RepID=A0A1R3H8K7_9ROSI|nr:hypothetical protein COLO4_30450 [Corchorus olitorius]
MASKQATLASALVMICLIVLSSDMGGVKCQPPTSDCYFIVANCTTTEDCLNICAAQGYNHGAVCGNYGQIECCCIITT